MQPKKKKFNKNAISIASGKQPKYDDGQSYDYLNYLPGHPQIPIAAAQAMSSGANPQVLNKAKQSLGNQDFIGLCEKFIETVTQGKSGLFPSAAAAWDSYTKTGQAQPGLNGASAGDMVYFKPDSSNQGYGHVGLLDQSGNLISATATGVRAVPLNTWIKDTGQQVLGHVKA